MARLSLANSGSYSGAATRGNAQPMPMAIPRASKSTTGKQFTIDDPEGGTRIVTQYDRDDLPRKSAQPVRQGYPVGPRTGMLWLPVGTGPKAPAAVEAIQPRTASPDTRHAFQAACNAVLEQVVKCQLDGGRANLHTLVEAVQALSTVLTAMVVESPTLASPDLLELARVQRSLRRGRFTYGLLTPVDIESFVRALDVVGAGMSGSLKGLTRELLQLLYVKAWDKALDAVKGDDGSKARAALGQVWLRGRTLVASELKRRAGTAVTPAAIWHQTSRLVGVKLQRSAAQDPQQLQLLFEVLHPIGRTMADPASDLGMLRAAVDAHCPHGAAIRQVKAEAAELFKNLEDIDATEHLPNSKLRLYATVYDESKRAVDVLLLLQPALTDDPVFQHQRKLMDVRRELGRTLYQAINLAQKKNFAGALSEVDAMWRHAVTLATLEQQSAMIPSGDVPEGVDISALVLARMNALLEGLSDKQQRLLSELDKTPSEPAALAG